VGALPAREEPPDAGLRAARDAIVERPPSLSVCLSYSTKVGRLAVDSSDPPAPGERPGPPTTSEPAGVTVPPPDPAAAVRYPTANREAHVAKASKLL
jgi:hypothetical protein